MSTQTQRSSLELIEIKPGRKFSLATLRDLLPDVETLLFFAKVYDLDASQLATLLLTVLRTDVAEALFAEGAEHSNELQDYLVGYEDENGVWWPGVIDPAEAGNINFSPDVPTGEILPQVWESLEVTIATSIKEVASKLESVVGLMPGKQGKMIFSAMRKMNAKRPTIGDYRANVQHDRQKQNLVIFDVSASVSSGTVRRVIDDVVAMSYSANAHMAIVSNNTFYWPPGGYSVADVLAKAQFSGTHYETLKDLFDRDWGVVICVADYDSAIDAKRELAKCAGRIDVVFDVSLVNKPTFLAECVGQLADEVRPLLIGSTHAVLT